MMSDIRSMLRTERAARRIVSPHLAYTKSGGLLCEVCQITLKSEAVWKKHAATPQHVRNVSAASAPQSDISSLTQESGRKRKAEGAEDDERKRLKSVEGDFIASETSDNKPARINGTNIGQQEHSPIQGGEEKDEVNSTTGPSKDSIIPNIDEREWNAFEKDIANLVPEVDTANVLKGSATIQAAPIMASDMNNVTSVDMENPKEAKDAEFEAEKDEAAQRLQEELDELERFDAQLKRLKERREGLRKAKIEAAQQLNENITSPQINVEDAPIEANNDSESDDDLSMSDDDSNAWRWP